MYLSPLRPPALRSLLLQVTGFSNAEEVAVGKDKAVTFLLEDRMKELGGMYSCGPNWAPFALASGKLITGQNPSSSKRVAEVGSAAAGQGVHWPTVQPRLCKHLELLLQLTNVYHCSAVGDRGGGAGPEGACAWEGAGRGLPRQVVGGRAQR